MRSSDRQKLLLATAKQLCSEPKEHSNDLQRKQNTEQLWSEWQINLFLCSCSHHLHYKYGIKYIKIGAELGYVHSLRLFEPWRMTAFKFHALIWGFDILVSSF